jgi:transcriptional regulator GlxA family with amidase domain
MRTVLDELRFEVAGRLVSDAELPLAQVSSAVNFSAPAAFTRAFERWSGGVSPQRWRHLDRRDDSILSKTRERPRTAPDNRAYARA